MLLRSSIVLAVGATIIYVALTATHGLPGANYYDINAEFGDAKGIVRGSQVWIAGHQVGQVRGSHVRDGKATLELQLDGAERLPRDTTARLRFTSLLGAKVIELTPGDAQKTLGDGDQIDTSRTSSATELSDALSALDAARRPELQTTIETLGGGFAGRGPDLNDAIAHGARFFDHADTASQAILARDGAAQRFFPSLETLAGAAVPVRGDIAEGFRPQADVLGAIGEARPSVERLLDVAPADLAGIRAGLARSDSFLTEAAGLAKAAQRAFRPAPPALRATRTLLQDARDPLKRLGPVLRQAQSTVPAVLKLTSTTSPIISRARASVTVPLPGLDRFNAYECDYLTWARNWRSMLGFASVGSPGPTEVGPSNFLRVEAESAGTSQSAFGQQALDRHGNDPAPAPCTAGSQRVKP